MENVNDRNNGWLFTKGWKNWGKLESVLEPTSPSFPFFDYVLRLTVRKVKGVNG